MLHDLEFGPRIVLRFFPARIDDNGVIHMSPFEQAFRVEGIGVEGRP